MEPEARQQILRAFLDLGSSDILQFAELRQVAAGYLPSGASYEEVLQAVVTIVTDMVESGDAIAGPIKGNSRPLEVVPLTLPRETMQELLFAAYANLGDPPELWGVIWVALTPDGLQAAERLRSLG